jgi:hypothetical protein
MLRKFIAAVLVLLGLIALLFIPFHSYAGIHIRLTYRDSPLQQKATGAFLDADGKTIATIPSLAIGDGNGKTLNTSITWTNYSAADGDHYPPEFAATPSRERETRTVVITAPGCKELRVPVAFSVKYEGPAPAFISYSFSTDAALDCAP